MGGFGGGQGAFAALLSPAPQLRTDFSLKCTVYNRYLNKSWLERGKKGRKAGKAKRYVKKGCSATLFPNKGGELNFAQNRTLTHKPLSHYE